MPLSSSSAGSAWMRDQACPAICACSRIIVAELRGRYAATLVHQVIFVSMPIRQRCCNDSTACSWNVSSLDAEGGGRDIEAGIKGIWPATETVHMGLASSSEDWRGIETAWE